MSLAEIKAEVRTEAFARRKTAFSNGDAGPANERLRSCLAAHAGKVLAGYMPMRTEIDPLPSMAAHQGTVCVPVIAGKGQPLKFREWTPDAEMEEGPFGAQVPRTGAWLEPEVLIVPLVAFDRRGYRLGYGGGFYDRTLELLRARRPTLAIGFAWSAQEMEAVPIEPTDQPLDLIVTERETIRPT